MTRQLIGWLSRSRATLPGLFACLVVAMAARFLSDHYGAPVMLFALLLGIAFHFLSRETACAKGIGIASTSILRIGVALLGIGISASDTAALGVVPLAIVIAASTLTILFGVIAARALRVKPLGILTRRIGHHLWRVGRLGHIGRAAQARRLGARHYLYRDLRHDP